MIEIKNAVSDTEFLRINCNIATDKAEQVMLDCDSEINAYLNKIHIFNNRIIGGFKPSKQDFAAHNANKQEVARLQAHKRKLERLLRLRGIIR